MPPNSQTSNKFADAVREVLRALQNRHPFFRTEADFQCKLADEMKVRFANVHTESKFPIGQGKFGKIDIVAELNGALVVVETKHKMKKVLPAMRKQGFQAGNNDVGARRRCLLWEDVRRLEQVIAHGKAVSGFAVFITNRERFWRDNLFREVHEGKVPAEFDEVEMLRLCRQYGDSIKWLDWGESDERGVCKCAIVEAQP